MRFHLTPSEVAEEGLRRAYNINAIGKSSPNHRKVASELYVCHRVVYCLQNTKHVITDIVVSGYSIQFCFYSALSATLLID